MQKTLCVSLKSKSRVNPKGEVGHCTENETRWKKEKTIELRERILKATS